MAKQTEALLLIALLMVVLLVAVTYASRWLMRRAVRQVLTVLKDQQVTSPADGRSPEELGFAPQSILRIHVGLRDYRPYALQLLIRENVVKTTPDGRIYLSEEELERSPLKRFLGSK